MSHHSFSTQRLELRPTTLEDAEFIHRLYTSPKCLQYIGDRKIRSRSDAETYIQANMLSQRERLGYSSFTLISREGRHVVGICGLYDRAGLAGIDLGFALLPEYEGKGYAAEAAKKLLELAFSEFQLSRVQAITREDNQASQKLLKKLGFMLIGTTILAPEQRELLLYRIDKAALD